MSQYIAYITNKYWAQIAAVWSSWDQAFRQLKHNHLALVAVAVFFCAKTSTNSFFSLLFSSISSKYLQSMMLSALSLRRQLLPSLLFPYLKLICQSWHIRFPSSFLLASSMKYQRPTSRVVLQIIGTSYQFFDWALFTLACDAIRFAKVSKKVHHLHHYVRTIAELLQYLSPQMSDHFEVYPA